MGEDRNMLTRSQSDSDFAGGPSLEEELTGLVAQIGNHTVKSGSTLQSWTALSVGEAGFYAVVKGGQFGLSLRSTYQDLGIPMKIEIQVDNVEVFDRSIGSKTANETLDTRYFWTQERVQYGDLNIKKVRTGKKLRRMLERSQSLLQNYNNIANLQDWYSTDHGSHSTTR